MSYSFSGGMGPPNDFDGSSVWGLLFVLALASLLTALVSIFV